MGQNIYLLDEGISDFFSDPTFQCKSYKYLRALTDPDQWFSLQFLLPHLASYLWDWECQNTCHNSFVKKTPIHCCLTHLKLIKLVQKEHRFVCFPHNMVNIGTPFEVIRNNGPQEFEGRNILDDQRVKRLKFVFSCGIPLPFHWFWQC